MVKGWYGDSHRHSLASRGIKTTTKINYIQYKQNPSDKLINELEYELTSLCANGLAKKKKAKKSSTTDDKIAQYKKEDKKADAESKHQRNLEADERRAKERKEDLENERKRELENRKSSEKNNVVMSKSKKDEYKEKTTDKVKKSVKNTIKSLKQTKQQAKNIGKAFSGIAKMGIGDAGQMFKEMGNSASLLQLKDVDTMPTVIKTTLIGETVKIDNDIKTLDDKIKERRKEIREQEHQDKIEFKEWYDVEQDAYELVKDSVYSSGMSDEDKDYELRKEEIEFKASIEQNKHLLKSNRGENDADIEHMRDLQSDLKRLRREVKKKVSRG